MSIYVIGACNIDITAKGAKELVAHDSNPGKITMTLGGVGHNVAKNIHNLTNDVIFISTFGFDHFGKIAYEGCLDEGLDLKYSHISTSKPQSLYLAVLDADGDMSVGVNDMRLIEDMTYEDLKDLKDVITADDYLMVDNNLKSEISEKIFKEFKGIKFTDAISASKAPKLLKSLAYIDILKVNRYEGERLSGMELKDEKAIFMALRSFMDQGTKEVILTFRDGLYRASDGEVWRWLHGVTRKDIINATGAGDALLGAYIGATYDGYDKKSCIAYALAASLMTIEDEKTVSDLTYAKLDALLAKLDIKGEKICY